jgi:hypothetical protein
MDAAQWFAANPICGTVIVVTAMLVWGFMVWVASK